MKVADFPHLLRGPLRLCIVAAPEHARCLPGPCQWEGVACRTADALPGAGEADVVFVLDPLRWERPRLQALRDHAAGVVVSPDHLDAAALRELGLRWLTMPVAPVPGLATFAVLPPPLRMADVPPPDLSQMQAALRGGDADLLAALRQGGPVAPIAGDPPTGLGICIDVAGPAADLARLLCLAQGALLITDVPFPPQWGIEPDEDYLLCAAGAEGVRAGLAEARRYPALMNTLRVRGQQKLREAFAAEAAWKRLLHDILLLEPPWT